jgi:transcriptional regulator with XRE-family HTH domain
MVSNGCMTTEHPIRQWLADSKWNQARLARAAGVSDSLLSKYLRGEVDLSADSARAIREVTGLSLDQILARVGGGR